MENKTGNTNMGYAIASLVLGICATICSCCIYYISIPCSLAGIVLGALAVRQEEGNGKGLAIAGLVLSAVSLIFAFISIFFIGASILSEL